MRLKSEIWIKAYIRICAGENVPAVVVRHGDDDAGAVFIKVSRLDGTACLFGPAPSGYSETQLDRRWSPLLNGASVTEQDVDDYVAQQLKFDPDLWLVEVEDRRGRHFLDDWLAQTEQPPITLFRQHDGME
ncbi:MAG: DUF1491 family protein [Hyphomicrobiaceae bacterium]